MNNLFRFGVGITGTGTGLVIGYKYNEMKKWHTVTEHEVIHAWLRAEATDSHHQFSENYRKQIDRVGGIVLNHPSFTNEKENEARRQVFDAVRGKYYLWAPIHESTTWYKTMILVNYQSQKIIGPYPPKEHNRSGTNLNNIILWGHNKNGPLIVLEGNHRWYAKHNYIPYFATVYIGISDQQYDLYDTSFSNE